MHLHGPPLRRRTLICSTSAAPSRLFPALSVPSQPVFPKGSRRANSLTSFSYIPLASANSRPVLSRSSGSSSESMRATAIVDSQAGAVDVAPAFSSAPVFPLSAVAPRSCDAFLPHLVLEPAPSRGPVRPGSFCGMRVPLVPWSLGHSFRPFPAPGERLSSALASATLRVSAPPPSYGPAAPALAVPPKKQTLPWERGRASGDTATARMCSQRTSPMIGLGFISSPFAPRSGSSSGLSMVWPPLALSRGLVRVHRLDW